MQIILKLKKKKKIGSIGFSLLCVGFSLVTVSKGYSLVAEYGLLVAVASPLAEHRLSSCGSQVLECRLISCGAQA